MSVIKTTNTKQLVTDEIKIKYEDTSILVVYKSNGRRCDEVFENETIEQIEEIYKNWNSSLKPHEHKRTPIAYYSIYNVVRLTKIK